MNRRCGDYRLVNHLTPPEMEAIVAHELCHIRRRDNLATAIHMSVEAIFWFHPLTWWLGVGLPCWGETTVKTLVISFDDKSFRWKWQ